MSRHKLPLRCDELDGHAPATVRIVNGSEVEHRCDLCAAESIWDMVLHNDSVGFHHEEPTPAERDEGLQAILVVD